ncbi:DUF1569 domain-containing protein [Bacteroidota bacterium]
MKTLLNQSVRVKMAKRIEAITGDEKPVWGKMSVQQMICHSSDQIKMSIGEIETKYLGNRVTEILLKRMVLWGMPTPKGKVETVRELKQGQGGTKPTSLDADKNTFIKLVKEFDSKFPSDKRVRHPAFGVMTKKEWGRLAYIHADYHLKQFRR